MHRFSRLFVRYTSYLLLAFFLLQLSVISPVSAQRDHPLDEAFEPIEVASPMMAYQPPENAAEMRDFAPENTELRIVETQVNTKANTSFNVNGDSFITTQDKQIGVFIEENTFTENAILELTEISDTNAYIGSLNGEAVIRPSIIATNTISNTLGNRELMRFQLDFVLID